MSKIKFLMFEKGWPTNLGSILMPGGIALVGMLSLLLTSVRANAEMLPPISEHPISVTGIISADVLARTELLRAELELIRFEIGKPKDTWTGGLATDAHPHEVYFQTLTLFLKANRLSLELTGSTGIQPEIMAASTIRPYHVWVMVNAAYDRILAAKRELGITESVAEKPRDAATTPTESGRAVVQANRQLNMLLERPFTPSDVFHQVTMAIHYAAELLDKFRGVTTIPDASALERGKQPADVFLRLVDCYERLESVARISRSPMLHIEQEAARQAANRQDFHPSDVYDMATLLVSDLAFLHSLIKDSNPPKVAPYPGRKFPSHVYQQAGVLFDQLVVLEEKVKKEPDWLSR